MLGSKPREKVQIFYRVTQSIWNRPDVPLRDRNKAIMEALGVDSLEAAWAKIMNRPDVRRALRSMNTSGEPVDDTDSEGAAYAEAERTQYEIDTPTVVMLLQMVEGTKAYGAPQ